jgi:hypothetical protein
MTRSSATGRRAVAGHRRAEHHRRRQPGGVR